MGKSHRTTITIPQELKARMDAVEESINWSAVACRAFEQKLGEIISRKGAKDMQDVIERLRASRNRLLGDLFKLGVSDGRKWAEDYAESEELDRLYTRFHSLDRLEWHRGFDTEMGDAYDVGERLHATISGHKRADQDASAEFWKAHGRADARHESLSIDARYVRGFAEGALSVWDEVKDQL